MGVILDISNVTVRFGGVLALDDVSFKVNQGEFLCLIGPNGAGKTTLLNIITATERITSGEIFFDGLRIERLKTFQIGRLGIARTFQIVKPFKNLTVRENVIVGAWFGKDGFARNRKAAIEKAEEIITLTRLQHKKEMRADQLTISERKRVELAKALAMGPKLLLLDEVMAGLNLNEIEDMMDLIRHINSLGVTILVIEHVMKAIMGISDRVMVLHHGAKIAEGSPEKVINDERVIEAYLGQKYAKKMRAKHAAN